MVCGRDMLGRMVSDKTERFALEGDSLANDVTVGKDILDLRGEGRALLGRGRRPGQVFRVRGRMGWTWDDLRKGGRGKRGGRKRGKRGGSREGRGKGQTIMRQVGLDATLLCQRRHSEAVRIEL